MGSEEELLKIGRKLEKRVNGGSTDHILDLLKELQRFQMTVPLLRSTRIGVTVNKLKKRHDEREIGDLAKNLIKAWKKLLDSSYKEKTNKTNTQLESPPRAEMTRPHTSPQNKLHPENPSGFPDNFLQPENKPLISKDAKRKRRHSADIQSTPKKQERRQSLGSPTVATPKTPSKPVIDDKDYRSPAPVSSSSKIFSNKEERRQSLGSPTVTIPKTPSKPTDDKDERILSLNSPNQAVHKANVKPRTDTREERKHTLTCPTPGASNPSSKPTADHKKERRHSVSSPTNTAHTTSSKPVTGHKEERRHSLGSPSHGARNGSSKTVNYTKEDRKHSVGSPTSTVRNGSSKHATDSKEERKHSVGSPTSTVRNGSSKHGTDRKKERKHSVESLISTVHNGASKPVANSKEERRKSIGSPTPASRNDSIKSENDMRDERICGGMLSPLGDSSSPPSCFMLSCYQTGDSVRDKCVEMITAALKTDDDFKQFGTNCDLLAFEIEESIYNEMKVTDMKYRNRVRSRISNLKDPKNPNLRRNVLCGVVTPQRIAIMTAEEMASDELRELRNTLTQEAIREHQMAKTGGTQTDFLQCDKCKKKNCTYNQVQTRSADEPMTTFVLCNECGNRWKFC
ncbi:transcription elongation factor A protein 3-like isoform X2 [Pelobates fuscus]|uniref:transcription elongation factor A protein 3-like isoform X2 n=1 Tax=Pelobates fuscus TaxID=191477 RepID=UPI002FE4A9D9